MQMKAAFLQAFMPPLLKFITTFDLQVCYINPCGIAGGAQYSWNVAQLSQLMLNLVEQC